MSRKALALGLVAIVVVLCAWPVVVFSMRHYLPEVDNDEVMYFLLVKVFRSQGFHGGYSFVNDRIPASPIHFDAHGPGTTPLYGQLARLVGWTNYSPYLANLLLFVPSWLLLAYALRRRPLNQIAAACFVLANGYFFMFLPSAMQESFHLAVAVAAAALWYIALDRESAGAWAALFVLIALATLVRYSWAIVIPCAVFSFAMQRMKAWRVYPRVLSSAAAALLVAALAAGAAVKILLWWAIPPVPASQQMAAAPRVGEGVSLARLSGNVSTLVHFRMMRMFADYPKLFAVSVGVTLAIAIVAAVRARGFDGPRAAAIYAAVMLLGALGAQLMFYEVDGFKELRVLAPAHALAGLLLLSFANVDAWTVGTREVVSAAAFLLIVVNALFTSEGIAVKYWANWTHRAEAIDRDGVKAFAALEPHFELQSGASSFCKTVSGDSEVLADPRLIYLPEGFALSVVEPERGALPRVRGKYALAKAPGPDLHPAFDFGGAFSRSSDWQGIAAFEDLTLFRSTVNCLP